MVIDEFGCGFSSLACRAQLPLHPLQIERKFVVTANDSPSAPRFCRGAISLARSYGLTPIAAGIDSETVRERLLDLGCEQGLGDCFAAIDLTAPDVVAGGGIEPPTREFSGAPGTQPEATLDNLGTWQVAAVCAQLCGVGCVLVATESNQVLGISGSAADPDLPLMDGGYRAPELAR
jgi:EAL domain-containing protein (putative c-di-GMP-specific phosphodiesterase class I)